MQFMEIGGRQYPVIGQVKSKSGNAVPMLDIKMMSNKRWYKMAEESAIRNFRKQYSREPVSTEEAFEWQRAYIDKILNEAQRTEKGGKCSATLNEVCSYQV